MQDNWTLVLPEEGQVKTVALTLLAMADDPRDVRTDSNGTEFRIPPYLAELYELAMTPPAETPPKRRRIKKEEGDE